MPIEIDRDPSPIRSVTATCRISGWRQDKETITLSDFDDFSVYLQADRKGSEEAGPGISLTFDEAEAFFKAGLEFVAQQRQKHA